mgnify:FL=1
MAKDRTVAFKLKAENDPSNAQAARVLEQKFRDIETAAKAATKAMNEALRGRSSGGGGPSSAGGGTRGGSSGGGRSYSSFAAGMAEGSRILAEERRERESSLRDMQRSVEREKNILRERVRANVEASRAIRQAAIETRANHYRGRAVASAGGPVGTPDDGFDAGSHVESLGRQRAQEERRAASDRMKAYKEVRGAAMGAAEATALYARSLVLLVAADSESAQRALQLIARYQAMADVVFGTAKAFEAAAKARKALEAVGGMRGLLTMGGGMASGGGGLLAAGALGGSALFAGALGILGGIKGLTEGKSFKEGASEAYSMFTEGFTELTGITDKAKESADKWSERWKAVADQLDKQREEIAVRSEGRSGIRNARLSLTENQAGMGLGGNARSLAEARARVQAASGYMREDAAALRRARDNTQVGGLQERMSATNSLIGSRDQYISDTREVLRLETEITREKINGERSALSTLQQRRSEAKSMLKEAEDAKKSALERFGSLPASERSRILEIAKKDQAGEKLTQKAEEDLAPFAKERVAKLRIDRAKAEGADKALAPYLDPSIYKARGMVNNIDAKIESKNEFIVKMEADVVKQTDAIAKALRPLLQANAKAQEAMLDMKLRELVEKQTLAQSTSGK